MGSRSRFLFPFYFLLVFPSNESKSRSKKKKTRSMNNLFAEVSKGSSLPVFTNLSFIFRKL